jgi:hypothetical protein
LTSKECIENELDLQFLKHRYSREAIYSQLHVNETFNFNNYRCVSFVEYSLNGNSIDVTIVLPIEDALITGNAINPVIMMNAIKVAYPEAVFILGK